MSLDKNPNGSQPLLYCNRKGFYSLNVQVVCDSETRIVDLVARWRGSAHDSRIWTNCSLRETFETGRKTGILLGDSGYANSACMLTPLLQPSTPAEEAYNRAHKSTRVTVECCFGRWKGMFKALQNNMQVSLLTAKACIAAMAVLYNIKLNFDEDWNYEGKLLSCTFYIQRFIAVFFLDANVENDEVEEEPGQQPAPVVAPGGGNVFRQAFIRRHFAH